MPRTNLLLDVAPKVMACTQKKYSILLGGLTQMIECTWPNNVQRGYRSKMKLLLCKANGVLTVVLHFRGGLQEILLPAG